MDNLPVAREELDSKQIELLKNTIAKGCSKDELDLFIQVCNRTGLDPFSRQIYIMRKKDKDGNYGVQFLSSIDGFRVIAERSGKYEGQIGPEWCGKDGKWVDVWLSQEPPSAARVGVYKTGFKEALYGVARFESYAQKSSDGKLLFNWAKMPDLMIAKCAESLALRKAFPMDLSGLYTTEEMSNVPNKEVVDAEIVETPKSDKDTQIERLNGIVSEIKETHKLTVTEINEIIDQILPDRYPIQSAKDIKSLFDAGEIELLTDSLKAKYLS
jgi:phage recombination protein Bet